MRDSVIDEDLEEMPWEELKKALEESERKDKIFNDKKNKLSEELEHNFDTIYKAAEETKRILEGLEELEKRSIYSKESLEASTTLEDINNVESEVLDISSNISSYLSNAYSNIDYSKYEQTGPDESTADFKTDNIYKIKPGVESPLLRYESFKRLTREEDRELYENLLKIKSLKINILGLLMDGVTDPYVLSSKIGVETDYLEKNLDMLVDFGQISTDKKTLSKDCADSMGLYKIILEKSKDDYYYTAIAIYPMIMMANSRPLSMIEDSTGLEKEYIIEGAIILEKDGLIESKNIGYEINYRGKTGETRRLDKLINDRYMRVDQ